VIVPDGGPQVPHEDRSIDVDVVLPAHNEAPSIGNTLREFHEVMSSVEGVRIRFVVCEDGSTDGTADVLRDLAKSLPLKLISDPARKGYSRAVIDGVKATEAGLVAFIDSDGQCDPRDFKTLLGALDGCDMVVGRRRPRRDSALRLLMSRAFKVPHKLLFNTGLSDPSCPYLIVRRRILERIMRGHVGVLEQGFWWEFSARAMAAGASIREVDVQHRLRAAGQTQVYRPKAILGIAARHLVGLLELRRELANTDQPSTGN
jgi:dolichol-phosphate mannosyltransferase